MNRDQDQFIDELFRNFYRFLLNYAESALKNASLAEEAVQETFAIACRRAERLCESENPRGWMVETLKFVIRNLERRQQTVNKIMVDLGEGNIDLLAGPEDPVDLKLIYGDVADTKEFALVYAIAVNGASYIDIAKAEGINVTACRKRFERAKKFLQKKIK